MQENRLIKQFVFSITDCKNKTGRLQRRWTDHLVDWCNKIYRLTIDRTKWTHFIKFVMDTNVQRALSPWSNRERERKLFLYEKLLHIATECHLPYGITHCNLPPDMGESVPP